MIAECPPSPIGSLLVFSDDWGRHPSSCQHLVRNLLDRYPVLWVNTIGTRAPKLDLQTAKRIAEKLGQWGKAKLSRLETQGILATPTVTSPNLTVVNPRMWPWFGSDRDRRFNRWLMKKQLAPLIRQLPQPVVAVTTLPITADLVGELPVDRWIYYCVDDFSQWPGLDGETLRRMDNEMIERADSLIAVSEALQAMIANDGRSSSLLTHGVDVEFWNSQRPAILRAGFSHRRSDLMRGPESLKTEKNHAVCLTIVSEASQESQSPDALTGADQRSPARVTGNPAIKNSATRDGLASVSPVDAFKGPLIVFWGVIDRRMDSKSLIQLSNDLIEGTIVLIGPQQDPDPALLALSNVRTLPPQPLAALPELAERANVLIMPYADLPVTRAMQPLKLKEYLATGKPVVVNRLPSTDAWSDCLDAAESPAEFSQIVRNRVYSGISPAQTLARCRLHLESWKSKAERFEHLLKCEKRTSKHLPEKSPVIAFKPAVQDQRNVSRSRR